MSSIIWLEKLGQDDVAIAGGKGAQLGELKKAGFSVPDGFVVSTVVYKNLVGGSGIQEKIHELLSNLDLENTEKLQEVSDKIQALFASVSLQQDVAEEILKAYKSLGGLVAVRSSATAEDRKEASFAGQQATFLHIKGEEALIDAVKKCMASLFTARAIFYRDQQRVGHEDVSIAVVIQKMVQAQKAGVAFSINPVTSDVSEVVIEAVAGLGEAVVGGQATPDNYVLEKKTLNVKERHLQADNSVLQDLEIKELGELVQKIAAHYGYAQDIEWAIDENGAVQILQARPVTTLQPARETTKWKKIISREYGVQYTELSLRSLSPENKFIVPEPFYEQVYIPEEDNEVCYIDEARWNAFVGALKERYLEQPENYDEFEKLFMETGTDYVEIAKQTAQENLEDKSSNELKKLYLDYQKKSLRYAPFIWIQFIINNFFADKAKEILVEKLGQDNPKLYDFYEVIVKPSQKAASIRLGEVAAKWKELNYEEKNQAYENFKWIPCLDIHNRPWTKEEFSSHVSEFVKEEKELIASSEHVLEEVNPSAKEKRTLEIARSLTYLKDLKDDFRRQGVFYGQVLFQEIAKRMGIELDGISYMLESEIVEFLDSSTTGTQSVVDERKNGFVIFFSENKEIVCKSGDAIESALRELGLAVLHEFSEEIKGVPASLGHAKGIVTIVRGVSNLSKVKKGDVLVAVVTHPDYVPAMQRAVAIVTDEGGITSHAAIVSRELGLPCIVGTEHATKALKDGDFVEVDATSGFVRKLKT